jgi:UAA transporter family
MTKHRMPPPLSSFCVALSQGSLVNVTVTITRKFFSILMSVALFGHPVAWWQWCGIFAVFAGLMYQPVDKYVQGKRKRAADRIISGGGNSSGAAAANGSASGSRRSANGTPVIGKSD